MVQGRQVEKQYARSTHMRHAAAALTLPKRNTILILRKCTPNYTIHTSIPIQEAAAKPMPFPLKQLC